MKLDPLLAVFNLGGAEIILILALVFILFGAKKLPELAKGLGQGIREFKKATTGASEEMRPTVEAITPVAFKHLSPSSNDTERIILPVIPGPKT